MDRSRRGRPPDRGAPCRPDDLRGFRSLTTDGLIIKVLPGLADIAAEAWDACAQPGGDHGGDRRNPFVTHAFLEALEGAGCATPRTGWTPAHLVVEDKAGQVLAVAPAYLKTHSQGEYVFDHAFADAYERAGGRYYPKLQVCVPFTPVPGPRLLVRPGPRAEEARQGLIRGLLAVRDRIGASSVHVTFPVAEDCEALTAEGFLKRTDQQFHWSNEGYATFEDFLAALASRKRKAIRRERREALAAGLVVERLTGAAIEPRHWDAFFRFYMDTGGRKWGRPYLNRTFFGLIGERMAERIMLVMVKRGDAYIAGALNLIGDDALYGRNWGCIEDHPFLHFEVCYYQAIDFAIERGLKRVEAGAQGEHKLARGYLPTGTYSAHAFADGGFQRAVADYLSRETRYVEEAREELTALGPFRRGGQPLDEQD